MPFSRKSLWNRQQRPARWFTAALIVGCWHAGWSLPLPASAQTPAAPGLHNFQTPPYQSRHVGDLTYPADAATAPDTVTVRRASIPPAAAAIDDQREQLYAELSESYEYVDRLGGLIKKVARFVKPSVIHIEARKVERKGGRSEAFDEAGAGVAVEIDGGSWVLTNRHVIAGADTNEILIQTADGRQLRPRQVISDASTDVAVMRIDEAVPLAKIGRSDRIDVGDFVIAIGSPFGLNHSVTFGILSARGRRDLTLGAERIELQDFFQTDAAINPGNSGGPLLNLRGEVIGINTAIASNGGGNEGIGFAIPIDMAVRVAEELVQHGKLRRGYLGVTLDPEFKSADSLKTTGTPFGALVKEVRPGSPAQQARLQRGDVILEFDGYTIESDDHLVTRAGLTIIDREVPVVISRGGQKYRTTMRIAPLD